jgi:hypothetical protein
MTSPSPSGMRRRSRLQLLAILGLFAAPALLALVLGARGWQPGVRGHGEPIVPQRGFGAIVVPLADGGVWAWRDREPRMTLLALPGPACAQHCLRTLTLLRNARTLLNRNAVRLRLLYVGAPPAGPEAVVPMAAWTIGTDPANAFAEFRPTAADTVAAILVESNGTALALYRAGFDPNGLRKDLQKVIR